MDTRNWNFSENLMPWDLNTARMETLLSRKSFTLVQSQIVDQWCMGMHRDLDCYNVNIPLHLFVPISYDAILTKFHCLHFY